MLKGRSRGRRGNGGSGYVRKVPLRGLFSDGIWHCNCDPRLPAQHFQTKNGGKNHGRWFYTCQKAQPRRCDFFLWDDEARGREASAVLSNSRTEPSSAPQTPSKPSPYGLVTPNTSSRFRPASPAHITPYTPSKSSYSARSNTLKGGSQATATAHDSDSAEGFYDWPASDDDELSKVADQASGGHMMPSTETPRKALKTDLLSTPGKRRYDEMALEDAGAAWPTPTPGPGNDDVFTTPNIATVGKESFVNASLASPAVTPTSTRLKNALSGSEQESELASEILSILQTHNVSLTPPAQEAVRVACDKHILYTRGVMRGRDVSRATVKKKDERISELQSEIEGLRFERETNRAVVRHLRRDMAARKDGG